MAEDRMKAQRLLHDILLQRSASDRARQRTALIADGQSYSFGQLRDSSLCLAGVLRSRGVGRGDRVAIQLENSWACVAAIFATLIAGGVLVLLSPQTKTDKLEFILRDCGARALIRDAQLEPILNEVLRRLEEPPVVLCTGEPKKGGAESLETALAASQPLAEPVSVIPLDLAAILYTSGSTGASKGVMQTHQANLTQ